MVTIHDVFFLQNPEWFPRDVARYKALMLDVALAKRPAHIVCVSEWTRRSLLTHRPKIDEEVVTVVPSGIEQADRVDHRPNLEAPSFVTISNIQPWKNHLMLLRALRRARADGFAAVWRIVGAPGYDSGEILDTLRREPGVELLGRVSEAEKARLLSEALFAATPSLAEGFGFPPLEAMASGVPVVCSTGSALDETAGDAALRVEADDEDAWSAALIRLATDSNLRERLSAAGAARAKQFTWSRSAAGYVAAYRRAVAD
jgi:alpha-1,3-rhamnosyl/mannosyltransferase